MITETMVLLFSASTLGVLHTLLGPDHYVPFAALSLERKWTMSKTIRVTLLCGLGHIFSSVLLGLGGIALGAAAGKLEAIESFRGGAAGWALMSSGLLYAVWGLKKSFGRKGGTGSTAVPAQSKSFGPWVFFLIFVFGPCEPLIPLLMYPAAHASPLALCSVTVLFGAATVATMAALVFVSVRGLSFLPRGAAARYAPAFAGLSLLGCGMGMALFGL